MKYSLISVISCALKTVLPLAKSGAHNLAKYLSSLQFSLSTSLQKLKFGEKLRIQVSDVVFDYGVGKNRRSWACVIFANLFQEFLSIFLYFLSLMQDSSNCRSVISDFIINVPQGKLVYPQKICLPTLIIVTVGPLPSHRE